jgi:hypothetical protein
VGSAVVVVQVLQVQHPTGVGAAQVHLRTGGQQHGREIAAESA